MKVKDLLDSGKFQVIHAGDDPEREITTPFCCDLLSVAMGKAPAGCAWVTVMGNMNTLAVAPLADAACIILAEGAALDETARKKAEQQDIMVLATQLSGGSEAGGAVRCACHTRHGADYVGRSPCGLSVFRAFRSTGI